ncbi:hypothetical protein ALC60_12519 [Trachymyrmex zeteki]|uniref:Uncharacterized protein n=1 Tax=Mycetomoellerius zeteki TaxID=64791 RepID=A0A151WKQ3_9HYME|nr:hypothetical protein ALC60_12519 [Trachymyrmex zeteki]
MGQSVGDTTIRDRPDEEIGKHSSGPTRRTNMRFYERKVSNILWSYGLHTDNKAAMKEAERAEGLAEKANDVRKPGKEIEKVREIWRSSGAVPRIRICINRPLSRGWFIESSGGVCRYIERRICNSSCPGLGNHYDKVAEDTDIKGEGEVIPRRSSEMPEN